MFLVSISVSTKKVHNMNKVIAGVAAAGAMAISMGLSAVPAQAGSDDQKVQFCHSNEGSKGFSFVDTSISAVVDVKTGVPKGHGVDPKDIIPAFEWVNDGVRYYFDGRNLDKVGQIDIANKSCASDAPDSVAVVPNAPTYAPPVCPLPEGANEYGQITLPENLGEGVEKATVTEPTAASKQWTVTYTLKSDTADVDYEWANGQTGVYTLAAKHISEDDLWVVDSRSKEGRCELSNTGAAEDLLLWGTVGGVAVLGGAVAMVATRRKNEA
jgi:hypothetical protein